MEQGGTGQKGEGSVQEEVCHIWTLCWKAPGFCCLNSGKSTLPFWISVPFSVKRPGLSQSSEDPRASILLGDVYCGGRIPWVVGFSGWEGSSVQMPKLS